MTQKQRQWEDTEKRGVHRYREKSSAQFHAKSMALHEFLVFSGSCPRPSVPYICAGVLERQIIGLEAWRERHTSRWLIGVLPAKVVGLQVVDA